ncbi:hypothetical protein GRF29_216g689443, partial [Pseudopithomyces chartarum]
DSLDYHCFGCNRRSCSRSQQWLLYSVSIRRRTRRGSIVYCDHAFEYCGARQ